MVFEIDTIIVSADRLRGSTATGHTVLLKEATAISEHGFCNNAWVVGTCQSNIHVDGKTQGFPAEHRPNQHTASTSWLPPR